MPLAAAASLAFNGRPGELQPFAAATATATSSIGSSLAQIPLSVLKTNGEGSFLNEGDGDSFVTGSDQGSDSVSRRVSRTEREAIGQSPSLKRTADDILAQAYMDADDNDEQVALSGFGGSALE